MNHAEQTYHAQLSGTLAMVESMTQHQRQLLSRIKELDYNCEASTKQIAQLKEANAGWQEKYKIAQTQIDGQDQQVERLQLQTHQLRVEIEGLKLEAQLPPDQKVQRDREYQAMKEQVEALRKLLDDIRQRANAPFPTVTPEEIFEMHRRRLRDICKLIGDVQ